MDTHGHAMAEDVNEENDGHDESLAALSLAALGIVYGDIGTSPLYAIRESIHQYQAGGAGVMPVESSVLGILSLIFWSLILVISIKYLVLVLRADNNGEGGIIALTALITPPSADPERGSRRWWMLLAGLFGAALLWGDSMITPAISVVSAVEGLETVAPSLQSYIIPITIGILVALFAFQRRGTAGVGAVFGPITLVWFITLGALGVYNLWGAAEVFRAINPAYAISFFASNGIYGLLVLGSVFLVVTGGEALYADIGHFGTKPIRITWFGIVLPCLLLNYFGQGALILDVGRETAMHHSFNPFFQMIPEAAPVWLRYYQITIATAATIIASQAVISGAFSLTRQAVQLGYLPRLKVDQTSEQHFGQIYMPAVNWALMIACIGLVIGFSLPEGRASSNLAAAYGVAVTTDMVFTTILFAFVTYIRWGWSLFVVLGMAATLLIVDLGFWSAAIVKVPDGGWFPLVVAGLFFLVMTTWKRGRAILAKRLSDKILPYEEFFERVDAMEPVRVEGTAVYMSSSTGGTPHALQHNLKHNRVLHERVIMLTLETQEVPYIDPDERARIRELGRNCYEVVAEYGFAEDPDVPKLLDRLIVDEEGFDLDETTFFLGRENLRASEKPGMSVWREKLFALISRNARQATAYFRLPPDRVVEVGTQVRL
jgi:KUP system potassium uptake protein